MSVSVSGVYREPVDERVETDVIVEDDEERGRDVGVTVVGDARLGTPLSDAVNEVLRQRKAPLMLSLAAMEGDCMSWKKTSSKMSATISKPGRERRAFLVPPVRAMGDRDDRGDARGDVRRRRGWQFWCGGTGAALLGRSELASGRGKMNGGDGR